MLSILAGIHRAPNQSVQRTGASRFVQRQVEPHRRLAPVAELCVRCITFMTTTSLEESLIDFKCPHCKAELSFPEFRIGTAQECPFCFKIVVVPTRGSEMGGRLPVPIRTPRLRLRLLTTEDQIYQG